MRNLIGVAALLLAACVWSSAVRAGEKLNVLFIAVDDLRPELGCLGDLHMVTPNIDRLAASGLTFGRAYAQWALCNPSRNSVFSGCRPDTIGGAKFFRQKQPHIVALPQHFRNHGYYTRSFGKILHHNGQDDPISWSEPRYWPEGGLPHGFIYAAPENLHCKITMDRAANFDNPLVEMADVPDNAYADGLVADEAIKTLRDVADRPFFLAVGFFKPHTPFCAPKKYWDLYRREKIELAHNPLPPENVPDIAMNAWRYVRSFREIPSSGPMPADTARLVKHAYYACVSFVDAQVGRLLDELDRLSLANRTVVVLWSDHGYQLGEHGMWCKHTNFETSVRTPVMIHVPGQKARGRKTDALVELIDLYPSLADLCGLPMPDHLEGTSFAPLIENPDRLWKTAAFSQYSRGAMGRSIRTDRYRFNEWVSQKTSKVVAVELYDHQTDPGENHNIANDPANSRLIEKLRGRLHAGWRSALPP